MNTGNDQESNCRSILLADAIITLVKYLKCSERDQEREKKHQFDMRGAAREIMDAG